MLLVGLFSLSALQLPGQLLEIKELNNKAWNALDKGQDSAYYYAKQALLKNVQKVPYQYTVSYNALGTYFQKKGEYDSAYYYFSQSHVIRKTLGDTLLLLNTYLNIGSLLYDQGLYLHSIDTLKKAIDLLTYQSNTGDSISVKSALLNILGMSYMESGNPLEAFFALSKAYELRKIKASTSALARTALNYGHIYELIGDYPSAKALYKEALEGYTKESSASGMAKCHKSLADVYLEERQYAMANDSYQKAKEIFLENEDQQEVAATYSNLGYLNEHLGNYKKSENQQDTALSIYTQIKDWDGMMSTLNHLGQLKLKQKAYSEAVFYFEQAKQMVDSLSSPYQLISVYNGLSQALGRQGAYEKAFSYKLIAESVFDQQSNYLQELVREKHRYEIAQQEKEILQQKLLRQKATNRNQSLLLYGSYALGLALSILFFVFWLNVRQKRKLQKAKEKERHRKEEIDQIMQDQKVHKMDALIEGQHSERIRIAQDLHDRLGSLLSILRINFTEVTINLKSIQQKTERKVNEVNVLIDQAVKAIREISQNLRAGVLDEMGLIPAIEELCQKVRDTGIIEVELHTESVKTALNSNIEWTIYRNTEEALNNILTHAEADKVIVQLFQGKDHISVTIEDNGVGFDPEQVKEAESRQSLGLKGMKARTRKYQGSFEIDSKEKRGTIIMMDFKLPPTEHYGE
jgi:signal transduction histidine kinase